MIRSIRRASNARLSTTYRHFQRCLYFQQNRHGCCAPGIRHRCAAFRTMSTPAFAMRRAMRPQCTGGSASSVVVRSISPDIPSRDCLRVSPTGDHHEAVSGCSCMSRLSGHRRGHRIRIGREQRYEKRQRQRFEHVRQFFQRRLLNTARHLAQPAARAAQPATSLRFMEQCRSPPPEKPDG